LPSESAAACTARHRRWSAAAELRLSGPCHITALARPGGGAGGP
jgi:hypothetical protein